MIVMTVKIAKVFSCVAMLCAAIGVRAQALPDTVYPSVKNIVYRVSYIDTLADGRVDGAADLYANAPGIFTFRGSQRRDAPFVGTVKGRPDTVVVDWTFATGYDSRQTDFGVWGGGTGWSGQPLFVRWPDSCMTRFRSLSPALTADFDTAEVIVGSLDAHIYFINYETGRLSRQPLPVGNTVKGTVSLDPTLNGNLYVGHGIPCQQPFGALVANINKHSISHFYPSDRNAWRGWNAYDSSPVRFGDYLFRPGENGTLYKFFIFKDRLYLHSTLQFRLPGRGAAGMEASIAIYGNYGYVSDNHGNIVCVNLNTMRPVWHYWNRDDSDGSPVLAVEEGVPYLYSGSEVDKQGLEGLCRIVKLNALDGTPVWEQTFAARRFVDGKKTFDGGMFSTPLLGRGKSSDLLFTNIVTNAGGASGDFVALRRSDGAVVYRTPFRHYAWSSPVGFLNEQDEMFVFTADTQGRVYLIDAATGEVLFCKQIGSNFESSPIVVDNHVILGSRGRNIFKMTVK